MTNPPRFSPARLLLAKTWLLLQLIRLGLSLFSFARVRRVLDRLAEIFPGHQGMSAASQQRTVWAVHTVGERILPDKPCLPQALAVQMLLKRRGISSQLRIGVKKNESGELLAHAWVEQDGRIIIGGDDSPQEYAPLPPLD